MLESGIFTLPDAARLIDVPFGRVRSWVVGGPHQLPIIDNQLGRVGKKEAISFTNLMELRFVSMFAKAGMKVQAIRAVLDEAKELLNDPHPFATNTVFRTDGRKIVAELLSKEGGTLYDLKSRNYEMLPVVLDSLKSDVIFDPKGQARLWRPRRDLAPNVVVHPHYSFGRPVLERSHIPTKTLADAVKAEGSAATVAKLYDVPAVQVRQAVAFQDYLRRVH